MPRNDATDDSTVDEACYPFERAAQAFEASVMLALAEGALEALEGYTWSDSAKLLARLMGLSERFAQGLMPLARRLVVRCAGMNDSWAAEVGSKGWRHDPAMVRVVEANSANLQRALAYPDYSLLRLTLASGENVPITAWFDSMMQKAYRGISDGWSYDRAIRGIADSLTSARGVRVKYNERSYDVYGFTRQAVVDSWHATTQEYRDVLGRRYQMDAVEVSAHSACADDHLPYQGRIYTLNEFNRVQSALERPLGKWNCRHIMTPCWHDSPPRYSAADLRMLAERSQGVVEVGGRRMTRYEATQWQRGMERSVRRDKTNAKVCDALGRTEDAARWRRAAREESALYREGSRQAGLKTDPRRLRVGELG